MAITLITQPDRMTAGYNDHLYTFTSTNVAKPNFNFVVDVYKEGGTTLIKRFKVPRLPDGITGKINLSSFLSNRLSFDLKDTNFFGSYKANNSQYPYFIKFGEEYSQDWTYDDYNYTIDTYTPDAIFEGKIKLVSTATHAFQVGQQINITQNDGGVLFPQIEGLHTILYVIDSTSFIIDLEYFALTSPGPTMGGTVRQANNETTVFPNLLTSDVHCVFNGALNYSEYITWDDDDYSPCTTDFKMLTSIPRQNFYVTPTQELFINFWNVTLTGECISDVSYVQFKNSNGDEIESDNIYFPFTNPRGWVRQIEVGPQTSMQYVANVGTLPIVKPNTEWYEFYLCDGSAVKISETIRVYIDRRCQINTAQLLFLDRFGSWGSFSFSLKNYEEYTTNKQTYNRELDYSKNSGLFDGEVTHNSSIERTYRLNTNWMTEEMSEYFEELISSPIVLFRLNDTDDYQPCQILTNTGEVNKKRNKRLFRKEITIKPAFGQKINI